MNGESSQWLTMECLSDSGARPSDLVDETPSDTPEETRWFYGNPKIDPEFSSGDEYHMKTPFTAVSSIPEVSRWQQRSSRYKKSHIQQKKGRRHRNRIAISSLTIELPLELRSPGIRPLMQQSDGSVGGRRSRI